MNHKIDWDAPAHFVELPDNPMPPHAQVGYLKARDAVLLRNAVFMPPSPRATIILLTGYSEYIEKYFETIGDLLALGYGVVLPEWRAHGLSDGRGRVSTRLHLDDFDINLRDLEDRWPHLVKPFPGPYLGLAHSMGGQISLRAAQAHPDWFDALAQSAPMHGIKLFAAVRVLLQLTIFIYWLGGKLDSQNPFMSPSQRPAAAETNNVTSDFDRFRRGEKLYVAEPKLQINAASPGWLHAAAKAMADSRRVAFLQSIATPLFIASAEHERLVNNAAHAHVLKHVQNGRGKLYAHAMHELMMEKDATRTAFLADVDAFFSHVAGI